MDFYRLSSRRVLDHFKVSPDNGLSPSNVESKTKEFGFNELIAKKKLNPFVLFLKQFQSFIIYILIFAVIVSILANEFIDAIVILIILIFNAFFGFIQEYKAEKAIEALKKLTALKTKVLRDKKVIMIDTKEVVPGDLVLLEEGDKVPADSRILESVNLEMSEASLTGESSPVSKSSDVLAKEVPLAERKNMVFSTTAVTKGRAKCVVTSIGMNTEVGKIAGMVSEVGEEMTPLQKKLEHLGKWIAAVTVIVCLLVFITGVQDQGLFTLLKEGRILEFILSSKIWFLTAVSLAVAAVPEGLPAIVTISLALGVRRMVTRKALIRRLPSVETLGETTVICSDKTGTLTKNEMTVKKVYADSKIFDVSGDGYSLEGKVSFNSKPADLKDHLIFKIGALCNNAVLSSSSKDDEIAGDPTEAALLVSAQKAGINHKVMLKQWKRLKEEPFDSVRKMMSVVVKDPKTKKSFVFTKGAPEHLLLLCLKVLKNGKQSKLTSSLKKEIHKKNELFASQALRVLGFAFKEYDNHEPLEKNLIFVGLQGMIDPPRDTVKDSVAKCKEAGIRVIMVTGDNRHTAEAVAKNIGIEGSSMNGIDFARLSKKQQMKAIQKISIFSRVEPEHKMHIVDLLQIRGEVVAMTGDGVNDAPALKKADIGIAMGIKGTDVSKEASDMILEDDQFTSIVNAVEEGRGIYENIKKFINYLLSSNLAEVLIIFLTILFGWPLPLTAIMLLWINLVTDGLPALSLSIDSNPKDLMKRPPKNAKEAIMNKSMMFNIFYVSILITTAVLGLFYWGMKTYAGFPEQFYIDKIETIVFTSIIIMELVRIQAVRSEYKLGMFSNKYLVFALSLSIILQLVVLYTPIGFYFGTVPLNVQDWIMIISATFVVYFMNLLGIFIKRKTPWFRDG